jgi:hypothetical protein
MELCTGGSLFNLLDDPENSYGLIEDEFLLGERRVISSVLNPDPDWTRIQSGKWIQNTDSDPGGKKMTPKNRDKA